MPPQMRRTSVSQSETLKLPRFISGNLSEIERAPWDLPHGETSKAKHHASVAKQRAKQQE